MTRRQQLEAAFASSWRHGLVLLLFALLPVATTWPLAAHLGTHVPGEVAGDNLSTLWSFWWMRQALASSELEFWRTTFLFHPGGVDLVQHTHTALNAFAGATVLGGVSEITALNITLLGVLTLAGFGTYLLVWDITGHRGASIVAGVFFCASPFFAGRLLGHFNFVSAWGLPFFAWAWLRALGATRPRTAAGAAASAVAVGVAVGPAAAAPVVWAVAAGVVLAAVAYSDYYYVAYLLLFIVCVLASRQARIRWARPASPIVWTWIDSALVALLVAALVIHTAIVMTGGFTWQIAGARISMRNGLNVRTVAWVLALVVAWRRIGLRPRVERVTVANGSFGRDVGLLAITSIVFALASWPLIAHAVEIWQRGDYVALDKRWHSAPIGIDPLAVLFGNPFHPLYGAASRALYALADINRLEFVAWFGVAPIIILIANRRHWQCLSPHPHPSPTGEGLDKRTPSPVGEGAGGEGTRLAGDARDARLWIAIAAIFGVWALGPYLRVAGSHTGLWLPASLTQYVPILSNARQPSRAIVMVYLSVGVLVAIVVAARARVAGQPMRTGLVAAIAAIILFDFAAQPIALYRIDRPAIFQRLAAMPPGAVCVLPLGLRDGIGELGRFEHRALADQMTHGKPIVGGFVARLPKSVFQRHEQAPIVGSLLRLSSGEALFEADLARDRAAMDRSEGPPFRYIVLHPADTAPQLRAYVTSMLAARLIAGENGIELYEVTGAAR